MEPPNVMSDQESDSVVASAETQKSPRVKYTSMISTADTPSWLSKYLSLSLSKRHRFKIPKREADTSRRSSESLMDRVKTSCLSMVVTVQEGFSYVKAFFVGQTRRLTAKSEKEATEAQLTESKMQVDATDEAENAKKRLHHSS
ncbi:uncharacterized protein LOC18027183 [Eutrema salsugineum]|nr:uncharacterized protein LOC18027183 [Eutrema salsugineum]